MKKEKLAVDAAMTAVLLLLMAYSLVGEAAHEWLGMGMFVLFAAHHVLNRRWFLALGKGRYTPVRVVQTVLAGAIFLCMLGSMVSGVIVSRHVFAFLPKHGGYALAQPMHLLCAFWGFVCMSLHLGLHGSMLLTAAKKHWTLPAKGARLLRLAAWLWAAYGLYAFCRRDVGLYLLLRSHFVFYDDAEPVLFFLLDYLSVMVLLVLAGYYAMKALKKRRTAA